MSASTSHPAGRKFARKGLGALLIKCGAAGLSFLMFVALSRGMDQDGFGQFSFAFSLATILAVIGTFGQRNLVLRFASVYVHAQDKAKANGVVRFSYLIMFLGSGTAALGLFLVAQTLPALQSQRALLTATAVFTVVLALAEFQPNPQRAAGSVWCALLPRDILFRLCAIALAWGAVLGMLPVLDPVFTLWAMTGMLLVLMLAQSFLIPLTNPLRHLREAADFTPRQSWLSASWGMWGNSVVNASGRNVAIVIMGALLPAAAIGSVFAAMRTAMVLELFLVAINIVAAPLLAVQLGNKDMQAVQKTCGRISLMLGLPTLLSFLVFVFFGGQVLELFGVGYASAHAELVIISFGYLVSAFAGPTTQLMEMSGHERVYFVMLVITTGLSLAALPIAVALAGTTGAALCISFNLVALNTSAYIFISQKLGISSGIVKLAWMTRKVTS